MSDRFTFDLQRFATITFKGGVVGDETGLTLSDLFNYAGKAWLMKDGQKALAEGQTYLWEKSALVELTPTVANADEAVAGVIQLVSGRYDDPTTLRADDTQGHVIKSVTAVDAEKLHGEANLKTVGSTAIVNPGAGATIAIATNTLTFGGGGNDNKTYNNDFGWEVGTKINVSNGTIKNVEAAATEFITTANGTTATFENGGTATFNGKSFSTIASFSDGGSAEVNVYGEDAIVLEVEETSTPVADGKTAITTVLDGQTIKSVAFAGNANSVSADIAFGGSANVGKDIAIANGTVNVANIAGSATSFVLYRRGADGGDILDLTLADQASGNKNINVSKTGKAKFIVATDYNADGDSLNTSTITIGGTDYTFTDDQANGGVFVVSNSKVTGFVFRDVNDAIRIPAGASLTLYELAGGNGLTYAPNPENASFADIKAIPVSFKVSSDSDYMVTKTATGYEVEVFDGTQVQLGDATIDFTLATARGNSKSPASAKITFGNDGLLQSISNGSATGSSGTNTGLVIAGTAVKVSGLNEDNTAEGFTIGGVAVNLESGEYTYEVAGAKNEPGTPQIRLNSADETILAEIISGYTAVKVLPYEGGSGKVTYLDNEYSFVNKSGDAYIYATAYGLRFVFVEAGDAVTIPEGAAATTDLYYIDRNNGGALTQIAGVPTVAGSDDYKITMTKATTRRSAAAEFELSGIDKDAVVIAGEGAFAYSAAGGTLLFNQTGSPTGITVAKGSVIMNAAAASFLSVDESENLFTIDGTGVNITATVDEYNDGNLVYNATENSLFGLAAGSVIENAGSITKIYAPTNEGTFTFGDPDAETPQAYTSFSDGDPEDNTRAYFTVDGTKATGFTFVNVDDMLTANDFSGLTLTDLPAGKTFAAPVVTEGNAPTTATVLKTIDDNNVDCYAIFNTDLQGKTVTFGDGTKATFINAGFETELFFDTAGKLRNIINLSTAGNEVVISDATGAVNIDDKVIDIRGGGFTYRMVEDNVPVIVDVKAGATILQAAGLSQIRTSAGDAGNGVFTFGDVSYEVAGNVDGVTFNLDSNLNVTGIDDISGGESVKIVYDDKIILTNDDAAKHMLDAAIITADASARTKATRIVGNALDNVIVGGTGKDTLYGKDGNDTIISGAGNDKLYGQKGDDLFIYTAGNDLIMDFESGDTLRLGDGTATYTKEIDGSDLIVNVGDNAITLKGAASLSAVNVEGKEIVPSITYTNANTAKQTLPAEFVSGDASARTKAIRLTGNDLDNSLSGGKGNDTLTGGKGSDVFVYTAGKDVVTDMGATDTLQIGDGTATYSKATVDKNIVVTVGKGSVTLTGAASLKTLNILGKETVIITADKQTLSAQAVTADATARTAATRIVGNALDNSILGGTGKDSLYGGAGDDTLSGGEGNDYLNGGTDNDYLIGDAGNDKLLGQNGDDTLWGGAGNDTLSGGNGADVFICAAGEGKDVITDFANDDMLEITDDWTATYSASKNTIAFKVGSTASAITLKNFTATTFNINGDAYHISGTKLVK